jgi:predicted ATPase
MLATAIADTLGVAVHGPDTAAELCDSLRHTELLLLLDGMEQLVAGADLLVELLRGAPNISVLATSRQPLNLQAEQIIWLHGLPVPPSEHDPAALTAGSVRLFVERVERLGIELNLAEQLPEALRICRLAAGLPLAIELAAALAGRLPLAEIAWAMEHNPDALTTCLADLPERHHSLRRVFDSSWQLLVDAERRVLAHCSVFRGSFTSETVLAALSFEATTLRSALAALVNKSLLHMPAHDHYELHQLLRPFAAEKLAAQQ